VIAPGRAYRYPISVGREGFTWRGNEKISRIADWPDWYPPAEMRERDPRLPEKMTGGINNPLGAKGHLPWQFTLSYSWHQRCPHHWLCGLVRLYSDGEPLRYPFGASLATATMMIYQRVASLARSGLGD
jgi:hypothetical protein